MPDIEVVLFDLGGVLIDFGGVGPMGTLAGIDDDTEVWRRWLSCRWVRTFERGECSVEDFSTGVVADWALPVDPDAFASAFASWLGDTLPGAERLVADVRRRARVGCLSNTNALHWQGGARWPFLSELDHRFLSFELGLVKPDLELFHRAAELAGAPPGRVLFLDDNQINVDGARAAGFRAEVVRGPDEARRALESAAVLP